MVESLKSEKVIRDYLLGRVSDETTLERIEELLFTDEEFCSQVALAEDGLINDFVFGHLDEADAESFRTVLAGNPDMSFKLELTQALREKAQAHNAPVAEDKPTFLASLRALFRQPKYAGVFALLLLAVLASAIYFTRSGRPDELAELRAMYRQGRPTEARISDFGYAPLEQLRGAPETPESSRLRHIENSLIEKTEQSPNAQTHQALGDFHLTQHKYADAIREFERALKFDGKSAKIHNDLGTTYFELAMNSATESRLENLGHALEEFTAATEADNNLLEALFNKSLALQEMGQSRRAKESWTLYLQKDSSSPWAEEARQRLAQIADEQTRFKSDEEVLRDFLVAYRDHDDARAQMIHNETKGLLKGAAVPLQLSRRYLEAKRCGDEAEAQASLEAMTFIGRFEQEQHSEFIFSELAGFYAHVGADKMERLFEAKDVFDRGQQHLADSALSLGKSDNARAISEFEKSRDLFEQLGDVAEAGAAEMWAAQLLPDVGKIAESRQRLTAIIAAAKGRRFNVLLPPAYFWLGVSDFRRNDLSQTSRDYRTALRLAEAGQNVFEVRHVREALARYYSELGELEPALTYAGTMLPGEEPYYQRPRQWWREQGTLASLTLRLKLFATSLGFSRERLDHVRESSPASSLVNSSLRIMVRASLEQGDFDNALKYADESLRLALDRGASPENTLTTAESYLLLADVKSRLQAYDEALTDYDKALEFYRLLPELTVGLYQIHKGRLLCLQRLGRQEDFAEELRTVLQLTEEYRATIREDSSRQAFFANEQDVFETAAAHAINAGDGAEAFDLIEKSRARSLLNFFESNKPLAEVETNFASVASPLSLSEIRERLPEQVQLVQYAVLPDRLEIWVVSKTRFELFEKHVTAAEVEKRVSDYQASLVGKEPEAVVKRAARELYELLIPPDLDGRQQLCLIPDKSLHQLAFASLVSPAGKYLLEEFALSYAPSASVLVLATENARRRAHAGDESLLSVGNPDFDREENPHLPDLRSAEVEAQSIAADYRPALALLGGAATKDAFLRNFVNVEVIHFAGHFLANRQSPGNSKLLFAGGDLRSSELDAYKLTQAHLVVLSACETGFERYDKSEGTIGAARTFLALGAPIVVASQWQVDSGPTKDLMIAFHRNRKVKGLTSAESLRRAQLEMLSRDETKAPFYWAAFALFGGYTTY